MKTPIYFAVAFFSCLFVHATTTGTLFEARAPPGAVEVLSIFNPTVVDHFYTTNASEIQQLTDFYGYESEGTSTGFIFLTEQPDTVPLFRLYSLGAADHMYTTSTQVRDHAVKRLGYFVEGILGFVYTEDGPGRLPFFGLHNPNRIDHYYTTSADQRDDAAKNGWNVEGGVGYLLSP
ncbi:hypothetical protein BDZ94DRAFT_1224323 [Collybia nuda]|uniref:DUF5648 domain-containing protein n=1 Tax=Collybia nuda TaxID=64659 RepID=A0A9P5XY46_9AGAR|nr:hypothetical protein BDZ94DRAFT_1224323 [Collybia nuda]